VVALEGRSLDVGLDALTAILRDYGHDASYECEAGAARALVSCAGKTTTVAAADGLAPVASALLRLVFGRVEFRLVGEHALVGLSSDMWRKLDRAVPQLVRRVFA